MLTRPDIRFPFQTESDRIGSGRSRKFEDITRNTSHQTQLQSSPNNEIILQNKLSLQHSKFSLFLKMLFLQYICNPESYNDIKHKNHFKSFLIIFFTIHLQLNNSSRQTPVFTPLILRPSDTISRISNSIKNKSKADGKQLLYHLHSLGENASSSKRKNKPSNTGIHKRFHSTGKTIFNFQFSIFNELYP